MAENNNNANTQQDQQNDSTSSNVTLSSNVPSSSSSNYIQPPKYQNPPQQFTFVPQNPALSSKTDKNHSPPPLPPQKNNVHYSHQKSYSMPQPQPQNPPEDLLQSLFGSHASSMSISEETLRAALQLKTEQERTKQEFYRLELQRKNAEILQNAIHNNIPQTMFPILFQHDQDHSSYQNQLHSNNLNQPMAPPTDSTSSPTSDNIHYPTSRNNHQRNLSLPPQPTIIPSEYQQRVLGPQNFKSSSSSQNTLSRHHGHHASLSSIPSTHYSSTPGPAIGQQSVFHSNPLYNNMQSSSSATRSGITRSGPSSAAPVPAATSWQHNASNPKPYFPSSKNPYPANPGSPSTSVHQIIQFHHWTPNQQKNSSSTTSSSSSPKKDDTDNTATKRRRSMTTSERHSDRIGSPTPLTKGPDVSSANNNNSNPCPANNSQTSAMASATAHSKRRGLHSRHKSETSVLRGDSLSKMSLHSSPNNITASSSSSSLASLTNSTSIKNLQKIQGNDVSGPANHLIHLGNHTPSLPPPAHQNHQQLSSSPSSPLRNNVSNNLAKSTNSNVSDATTTDSDSNSSSIDSMPGGALLKASPSGNTTQKVSTLAAVLNGSEPSNVANHNAYPSYHRHQNSTDSFNFLASVAADSQRLASPAKPSKHSSPGIGAKGTHSSSNSVSLARFPSSPSEISAASAAAAAVAVAVGTRSASFIDSSALGYATNTNSINTINKHERGAIERLNPDFSYPPKPASSVAITRDDNTNNTDSSKAQGIKSAKQDNGDQDVTMEDQSFQPSQSQHSQNLHSNRLDTITESIPRTSYSHSPSPSSPQKRNANNMNRNGKDDGSSQNDNKGTLKPLNTASEEQKCKKLGVGFIISESD